VTDRPVNAVLVGLGWWGRKMAQLAASRPGALRFVRAVDPSPEAAAFAGEMGIPHGTSLEEALVDDAVEAAVLATPHALHGEQIRRCVAAGRHVFCEKPLALTSGEAVALVRLCGEAGLVLGMGHERRFEPPVAAMLADADAGRFGRLLQIEANFSHDKFLALAPGNWRLDAGEAPAGGMTATGIHLTDLAIRLMGPARDVRASCENLVSELPQGDTMSAHVRFAGGGTAHVSASLGMPFVSRFALFGSEGWLDIRDKAHLENPQGWVVTRGRKGEAISVSEEPPSEAVNDNLDAFAAAVRGGRTYPITGEEMIANIALLEAIVASARTGEVVPVS
jgi:predicted dehydrogenase